MRHVEWLPDGFRYRFELPRSSVLRAGEVGLLVTLGLLVASLAQDLLQASVLLAAMPATSLATRALPRTLELRVDHQRLVVSGPLFRREVPVRDIRELEIYDDALELELWGGDRVRLPAPSPREQAWIVGRIREIRDEVQRFALDLALGPDADRVKDLSRLPSPQKGR
jgi:hypothetical protein